jgi:hypothetical protein
MARHGDAQGRRLSPGRVQLAPRGTGVSRAPAKRVRPRQPLPGSYHRGPVRQSEVLPDGRAEMIDGSVQVPRGQRGHSESLVSRPEAGDPEAADHRQVSIRAKQFVSPRGYRVVPEHVGRLDDAIHRHQPAAGSWQESDVAAA